MKLRNVIKDFIVCSCDCIYERFAIQFLTNLNFNSYRNDADFCICVSSFDRRSASIQFSSNVFCLISTKCPGTSITVGKASMKS